MTIGDLKELIEQAEYEGANDYTEVRLAMQPSWPFEYSIGNVMFIEDDDPHSGNEPALYIGEGSQIGYLPDHAKDIF